MISRIISEVPAAMVPEAVVAGEALDGEIAHVSETAVHLDGLVGDAVRHLGGVQLGHGDLGHAVVAARECLDRGVGQPSGRLNVDGHVGDAVPEGLELSKRSVE